MQIIIQTRDCFRSFPGNRAVRNTDFKNSFLSRHDKNGKFVFSDACPVEQVHGNASGIILIQRENAVRKGIFHRCGCAAILRIVEVHRNACGEKCVCRSLPGVPGAHFHQQNDFFAAVEHGAAAEDLVMRDSALSGISVEGIGDIVRRSLHRLLGKEMRFERGECGDVIIHRAVALSRTQNRQKAVFKRTRNGGRSMNARPDQEVEEIGFGSGSGRYAMLMCRGCDVAPGAEIQFAELMNF